MAKSSTDSLSFIRITSKSLLKLCPSQLTLKARPLELLDKLPLEPYDPFVRLLLNSEVHPTVLVLGPNYNFLKVDADDDVTADVSLHLLRTGSFPANFPAVLNKFDRFLAHWSHEGVKLNQAECFFFAGLKCIPASTTSCGQIIFPPKGTTSFCLYFLFGFLVSVITSTGVSSLDLLETTAFSWTGSGDFGGEPITIPFEWNGTVLGSFENSYIPENSPNFLYLANRYSFQKTDFGTLQNVFNHYNSLKKISEKTIFFFNFCIYATFFIFCAYVQLFFLPVLKQNKKLCTYAHKKSLHICKVFAKKKVVFSEFFFATGLIFERFLAPRSRFFEKVNANYIDYERFVGFRSRFFEKNNGLGDIENWGSSRVCSDFIVNLNCIDSHFLTEFKVYIMDKIMM
ncbi:hypothetical protein LXL04_003334 [Taraxacum kok-saghyz]